jgi:hypothetical protein
LDFWFESKTSGNPARNATNSFDREVGRSGIEFATKEKNGLAQSLRRLELNTVKLLLLSLLLLLLFVVVVVDVVKSNDMHNS